MAVHQLIPSFVEGDATGQAALHLRLLLRRLGISGELYAEEVGAGLSALAHPAPALKPERDDLVLYHHGIASRLSGALLHLPCRKAVVFHNVSPESVYRGAPLHEALVSARAQLAAMAPHVDLAIGVSPLNCAELTEAGFANVHQVPLFVEAERFGEDRADPTWVARLRPGGPAVLTVSRVVRHKRMEDLLSLHRERLALDPTARLWVVGGFQPGDRYYRELQARAKGLAGVSFLGRLPHAALVAAYRCAGVFCSMSEHEGFGVPLLEAMAADLPVMAFAAAAVPQTLGGRGIAFDEKRFAVLAELARLLDEDAPLRAKVLAGQRRRLEELSAPRAQHALAEALSSVPVRQARSRPRPSRRPKVALVVQRFGDVGGGAEAHARLLALQLAPHWDLTVLTSCAKDHLTWANELAPGSTRDGPLEVLRFPAERPRSMGPFNRLSRQLFGRSLDRLDEERWIAAQGPVCPGLFAHLERERHRYHGFVCFTYLYAPTAWGISMVADRAIVVPTAHDEPPLQFDAYGDVFRSPRALFCNTPEELALISRRFPDHAPAKVVGVGVDLPPGQADRFRARHRLDRPYLLYVGRIEEGKGVRELLSHYAAARRHFDEPPDLVLAGRAGMKVSGAGVRYLGQISEEDKADGLKGALAVVVPSRHESLSLLVLEAFSQGTPVLGNGASDVVRGQLARSEGGLTYLDGPSFVDGLSELSRAKESFGARGNRFARKHRWSDVVATYRDEMATIAGSRR